MCIETDGVIRKFDRNKILYKVVTKDRMSPIRDIMRLQPSLPTKVVERKIYRKGEYIESSLEITPGLYCFYSYNDARDFLDTAWGWGSDAFIIEVEVEKKTNFYSGFYAPKFGFDAVSAPVICAEKLKVLT